MKIYKTKIDKLAGTDYGEIYSKVIQIHRHIKSKTKRRPYIRSAYFSKEKVFLDYFWQHLWQKNWRDRNRRLKYYPCAIDLLKNSKAEPTSKQNPNKSSEILHRFTGLTKGKELFFVQVSENKKTDQKCLLSVFPAE